MNLKNIFSRYPIITVYLFGSRGRADENTESDYDFGVLLHPEINPSKYSEIKFSLIRELLRHLKKPVDVIIMNQRNIPLSLKFRILKEGRIIYEDNELIRSRFEKNILSLYLDRRYYFQRHINEVLKNIATGGLLDR